MKKLLAILTLSVLSILILSHVVLLMAQDTKSQENVVYSSSLFNDMKYRYVGPSRGGRVTAVAGIPSQPSTFYMGATGGGVWKTTDYGQSWFNVSDGYFETGSIGAIRVAGSDPDIVYVGTGSDGIRSNVITGKGVYKSTDAGKSWKFIGLRDVGQIGAVEIHPSNPDIVFVAAIGDAFGPTPDRGLYRTLNGGETWQKVLFISNKTGVVDFEFAPDNPDEMYAALWEAERKPWTIISGGHEGGIHKSTDGGDSWTQLKNGLPTGIIGKCDFAVSPDDPDRIYVLVEAPEGKGGLYRSDDRGGHFRLVSTKYELLDRPFYYLNVDADPTDADVVYINSTRYFKSTDAGKTWKQLSTPHGDNHDMWINPNNPDVYIQSNDGGANVTRDGGETWSTQENQPTAELYQVAVDDQFPYWLYAGQQDNSTIAVPSLPPYSPPAGPAAFWLSIGGCETGPAIPKPGNHNIVYANCKGRFGRYNKKTGQEKQYYVGAANMYGHNPKDLKYRFQRVSPIHVSPHDPNVVYHASQYLHKTTDEGVTWETISPDLTAFEPDKQVYSGEPITRDITGEEFYSTIYAVQESPLEKGLIWVGANDGPIHVTRDGGKTWTEITPDDLPPGGRVQTIEPSPHLACKAYVAVYRYLLGDWQPYIYRTTDYGKSWKRLTTGKNGIPSDYPTRVIREDPDREGLLYAGTEFGMFISFDDGDHWQPFQLNLPRTPVTDIKVYRGDLVLSTMGRSFWILDDITALHQINPQVAASKYYLYTPRDAYRMRYRAFRRSETEPEYIEPGVIINYYLADEPNDDVTLEFFDMKGNLIRAFSSGNSEQPLTMPGYGSIQDFQLERIGGENLSKNAGMHRFIWDLTHAGPWNPSSRRTGRGGPMIVPGTYKVKMTVGDWSTEEVFDVLIDPRIAKDGVTREDMKAQESLCLKVRDLMSKTLLVTEHIKDERGKLKKIIDRGGIAAKSAKEKDKKLETLESELVTAEGRYPVIKFNDQVSYLYSMLNRADQIPGRDAYIRYDELKNMLNSFIRKIENIIRDN